MPKVNLWYTQGKKSQEYSKIFFVTLKKFFSTFKFVFCRYKNRRPRGSSQTVDKALLLQGFAIVGTAFLI